VHRGGVDINQMDLAERCAQRRQVDVVGVAGAQQAQAPRPARRRAQADLAGQPGAMPGEAGLVADAAAVGGDLVGDGVGGGRLAQADFLARLLAPSDGG
jgi:hypothetical protein